MLDEKPPCPLLDDGCPPEGKPAQSLLTAWEGLPLAEPVLGHGSSPRSLLGAFMEKSRLPARREGVCGHRCAGDALSLAAREVIGARRPRAVRHLAMHGYGSSPSSRSELANSIMAGDGCLRR
ncbi:hypothetical protein Dimus_005827 [Dionaea muscipula]